MPLIKVRRVHSTTATFSHRPSLQKSHILLPLFGRNERQIDEALPESFAPESQVPSHRRNSRSNAKMGYVRIGDHPLATLS